MSRRSSSASAATVVESSQPARTRISIVPPPASSAAVAPRAESPSWDPSSPVTPWLPAARALAARDVKPCRANIECVVQNLIANAESLLAVRAEIDREGIAVDWAQVDATRSLALALSLVSARVMSHERSARDAQRALVAPRRLLAADATTLSIAGVFPAAEVRRLLRSNTDAGRAHGVSGLVELYRIHAGEIAGRTMVSADVLARATEAAESLLSWAGRSALVRVPRSTVARERLDLRDRFWTLAERHHRMLCRVGGAWWGREVTEHITGLQAKRAVRSASIAQPVQPPQPPQPA